MIYKNIFIDSDIFLDLLLTRRPFDRFSELLLQQGKTGQFKLCTSTLILANIYYLIAKNFNKQIAKKELKVLTGIIRMLPFEPDDVEMALNSEHVDFEDTIQFFIANKHSCDLIISRNIKHYKKFSLPVLTAEQFLEIL
ncbi:MAG: PilT protein [Mucilaginibacter sp.]|jgi:predicted nucleic acid-binding protein|nr:PilT protein [Mucilaginibacter sp.]